MTCWLAQLSGITDRRLTHTPSQPSCQSHGLSHSQTPGPSRSPSAFIFCSSSPLHVLPWGKQTRPSSCWPHASLVVGFCPSISLEQWLPTLVCAGTAWAPARTPIPDMLSLALIDRQLEKRETIFCTSRVKLILVQIFFNSLFFHKAHFLFNFWKYFCTWTSNYTAPK